jgi:hypothetical protein
MRALAFDHPEQPIEFHLVGACFRIQKQGIIAISATSEPVEKWTLKQVQGDGL